MKWLKKIGKKITKMADENPVYNVLSAVDKKVIKHDGKAAKKRLEKAASQVVDDIVIYNGLSYLDKKFIKKDKEAAVKRLEKTFGGIAQLGGKTCNPMLFFMKPCGKALGHALNGDSKQAGQALERLPLVKAAQGVGAVCTRDGEAARHHFGRAAQNHLHDIVDEAERGANSAAHAAAAATGNPVAGAIVGAAIGGATGALLPVARNGIEGKKTTNKEICDGIEDGLVQGAVEGGVAGAVSMISNAYAESKNGSSAPAPQNRPSAPAPAKSGPGAPSDFETNLQNLKTVTATDRCQTLYGDREALLRANGRWGMRPVAESPACEPSMGGSKSYAAKSAATGASKAVTFASGTKSAVPAASGKKFGTSEGGVTESSGASGFRGARDNGKPMADPFRAEDGTICFDDDCGCYQDGGLPHARINMDDIVVPTRDLGEFVHADKVAVYQEALQNHPDMKYPPISVQRVGDETVLVNGYHRYQAHKNLERTRINVRYVNTE